MHNINADMHNINTDINNINTNMHNIYTSAKVLCITSSDLIVDILSY